MPDQGYRSVEVTVTNDTRGELTVVNPGTAAGSTWIQGEAAKEGDALPQHKRKLWGVSTNDPLGIANAHVQLTGVGSYPVAITFTNDHNGKSSCWVTPNDVIMFTQWQIDTGKANHSSFGIQLTAWR